MRRTFRSQTHSLALLLLLPLLLGSLGAREEADEEKKATIADKTKNARKYAGLFTLYQDKDDGSTHLLIKEGQLNKEYVHFAHTTEGVRDAGHFRGRYRQAKVFTLRKYFNRIELVAPNTSYYFDEENPLSRASQANISHAVLLSTEIVAERKGQEYLISADALFRTENLLQLKPSPDPDDKDAAKKFKLGELNKDKTKYVSIRSYPLNTDVVVEYVYDNPAPVNQGRGGITDARAVSITVQHSLIAMPRNSYQPRMDDPRVGFFTSRVTDLTSTSATPYRDLIHRWQLVKKDPGADLSEPTEPIVWWLENTTPYELRDAITRGVLAWNSAFEAAGFKDAIQVKVQSDDATWEAGDIRYNVLRWTSSPEPSFGGYGPSFVNPRSGQILGADIMLEWVYFTNRFKYDRLYKTAVDNISPQEEPQYCSAGNYLHLGNLFGSAVLSVDGVVDGAKQQLVEEGLMYLALHEIGHTLGLMHNMKSSQLHGLDQVHDTSVTRVVGLTGSVMDYPAINLALDRTKQGQYYTTRPGPYDRWAIEFGYSPALDGPAGAAQRRAILSRSTDPRLAFGNDADDMRSPERGIDPRVMINDMSSDAIGYSIERFQLIRNLYPELKSKFAVEGASYHALADAFNVLSVQYKLSAAVVSRYIGGVYVDRAFVGQDGGGMPLTPVDYDEQKRALGALAEYVFAPDAFDAPGQLHNYLQLQRRSFDFWEQTEDPKLTDRVLDIHKNTLDHLLGAQLLKRMSDTQLYGNEYGLAEYLADLSAAIFKADARGDVNPYRQNLQVEYVNRLMGVIAPEGAYHHMAKSAAYSSLERIRQQVAKAKGGPETRAHRRYLNQRIHNAFEAL